MLITRKQLFFTILCSVFFLMHCTRAQAAENTVAGTGEEMIKYDTTPVVITPYPQGRWSALRAGVGIGTVMHRDMGTGPTRYFGIAASPTFGLWYDRPRWSLHIDMPVGLGILTNTVAGGMGMDAYDITLAPEAKILIAPQREWVKYRFMVGGSLTDQVHVANHPNYENAAAGFTNFFGVNIIGRVERTMRRHLVHAEVSMMPIALVSRPGYSYIGNPTADNDVASSLFSERESFSKPFALLSTDVGFDFRLRNGNRINLSYLWRYAGSGDKCVWRYDHAMHLVNVDFIFALKQKAPKK